MCEFCEGGKPLFEHRLDKALISKSTVTGQPVIDIYQGGYNLNININFCPKCNRSLKETK